MIRLNKNPVEGSAVKINVSFRDSFGAYYVPSELTYTFLALNSDEESWSVIDDYYKVSVTPESSVNITIPDVKTITNTKLQRRIILEWSGYVDGEYTDFKDEVEFSIDPMPYISNKPDDPEPSEVYIKITDISLQVGSLETTPITPVFKVRTSLPVDISSAQFIIKDESGEEIECSSTIDSTYTLMTVVPVKRLEFDSSYSLNIDGLICKIGDYSLEEPYVCNFVTEFSNTFLQYDKEITVSENGEITVEPDTGYDGFADLKITTAIPIQSEKEVEIDNFGTVIITPDDGYTSLEKAIVSLNLPVQDGKSETYYSNGEYLIEPDDDYTSLRKVRVNVDIPIEDERNLPINANGIYTITPTAGSFSMKKVTVDVNIPIQDEKTVTVTSSGTVEVTPDDGYTAIKKVTFNVNTESQRLLYAYKTADGNQIFYSTSRIVGSGTYTLIGLPSHSVTDIFTDCSVIKNGDSIIITYFEEEFTTTRDSDLDILRA